jgi:hypothetical protein
MSNAPSEARPAIDHAVNVLTAETATWRALLIEASPPTSTDDTFVIDDTDSQREERTLKATPEFPDLPEVITNLQSNVEGRISDIVAYPWETGRALPRPLIVPTQISLPRPISTSQASSNVIEMTQPASNRIPPDRDASCPHR